MQKNFQTRLVVRLFTVTVTCLFSCGIFTPRDSETPDVSGRVDPLNFAAIMGGTGEEFSKLRYEDLFNDAVVYEDINSGLYAKTQLIQRLQQIRVQYPEIRVQWEPGDQSRRNDTIILSDLKYRVFQNGNVSGTPDDSGSSIFTVVKDWEWYIIQWRDVPGKQEKSFFSP
ncbi:MAG: hypothetical protein JXA71_16240 [Chitinispirillaceae bacterium]|nr:hypothetical protein [Chitinispirillaceae bacterium]